MEFNLRVEVDKENKLGREQRLKYLFTEQDIEDDPRVVWTRIS
jgi:hypothetical protein